MVNPNGELADRLQGEWTSDDGRFTAMFTDLDVELTFGDQKVTTRYNSDYLATSPAAETHMMPVDNALTRPGEEEPFVWIQLFFTDGALDAELTYPDGTIERLALTRTEG